ncbi:MAG: glycerol-3-phosphate dehydrogenase [Hyphomicrobiaceae bacterium]|nr:glycerol-3-phosphate dehydrogenase [Hyphomicrobiaceae bacterium]
MAIYDIAIIGGGINGSGIARDASGRGLSVLLAEAADLASGTSSASTKLIHGGLRYLESYDFRLVAEALAEREVIWAMAPHIVWPLRFVLPHAAGARPAPLIRLGLLLYDYLGSRRLLPGSRALDLRSDPAGAPLRAGLRRAFEYSDCWVDDARLVVLNAVDAARRGADVRVRCEVVRAGREGGHWTIELYDRVAGRTSTVAARVLVNAAGPWVGEALASRIAGSGRSRARLVKGSHIVVPRLFAHERAYIFQNPDRRVVFAIPYERDFTLVGTTDVDFTGDPRGIAASPDEIAYLCASVSAWLAKPVAPADVVWSYAGVRSLYDDGSSAAQEVTRDFMLELDGAGGEAPVLSVFGGKITTYRRLAEAAMERLAPWLPNAGKAWTRGAVLPGGDFPVDGIEALVASLYREHPELPAGLVHRLARAYGTRAGELLAGSRSLTDLGHRFGADLTEREVAWLVREEWARTAEDILWRRSKLGLRFTPTEQRDLEGWLAAHLGALAARTG